MPDYLDSRCLHVCVDMQRMFTEKTDWHLAWSQRVIPKIVSLTSEHPRQTVFTKFIPPENPQQATGMWREYYQRWEGMTTDRLGLDMLELDRAFTDFSDCPCFTKSVYSPWYNADFRRELKDRNIDTLIISGGETDVCVLATVLGAVDYGYKIIIASDAVCSGSDAAHDAAMDLYHRRYSTQVFPMTVDEILNLWDSEATK
ncbi:MAG: isochorismatase hydrolase [Micavibrio sp.]|nr:isochorismatase hydrolase [Micavibrio sp.]